MSGGAARSRLHMVGVGGVGMAGLAVLLKARGHEVSGCDLHATPRTRWLEGEGVRFCAGHSPAHLDGVDELVVTPAVPADAPEVACARRRGVRVRSRGEVLAELVNGTGDAVAVCGSHGKTTTATWTAKLLLALGEDVAWCIGGETGEFPVARAASGPLVVEADESDGTLALYRAKTLVVTNCEYDHPDHFKTPADYFACYDAARRNAGDVVESEGLGPLGPEADACLAPLAPHNRRNARAAVEVALRRGHSLERVLAALPSVVATLPDRRFQRIYPVSSAASSVRPDDSLVFTDYAHHPTEMACAVGMARKVCRGTLRVLFQPHRYSRTKALLGDFPAAFAEADEVVLCPTYAAFESPVEGGDVADLYAACRSSGLSLRLFLARSCDEAWEHARNSSAAGDVTLLLGAGDIISLAGRVVADMSEGAVPVPPRRIWIGAGSNTWKSDLNLSVEYAKTSGPASRPGASLGIPWMAGIPGTVGGWVKMNAGAFGHSFSEAIESVKVDGRWIPASECGFAYRHSEIEGEIQDFRLRTEIPDGGADAARYLEKRRRFPPGTYGSFFKNPPGDHAGRLLDSVGSKGMRVGGAYVWDEHANVIVRGEGATSSDVLALARLMRNRVLFRLGVALEPEVCGVDLSC
ncbi:MAG: hypothetical protein IJQ65_04975 [Kiritimatiellae bacterium]|nr:hypothetical protein [Kiritimatiellia bacterium]